MSLLLNMLSRLVIAFLPRSKRLLISWLQSPSAVILEPPKNKVWHCFHCLPIYFPWSDGTGCHDLSFLNVEPKNWCFWTVVLEKTLESPLDCKEIQPVHSKGDQSWDFFGRNDVEAETPILWPPDVKNWLIWKDPNAGRDWGQEEKGTTEDEIAGWHHRLDAHEFGWTPGFGDGHGGLVCCNSWSRKELHMTERLKWTELNISMYVCTTASLSIHLWMHI